MFWRRKKNNLALTDMRVQAYAAQLGIERRRNGRILCPGPHLNSLPSVFFGTRSLRVQDISIGGACLIDKEEHMGPDAGIEVELRLIWPECERIVRSRLISRVDVRRHIQFLDMQGDRIEAIRAAIHPGVAGQSMRNVQALSRDVKLDAMELWTSPSGDSITISQDDDTLAEIHLQNQTLRLPKEVWPVNANGRAIEPRELERLLIFVFNIPRPTPALLALRLHLQTLYFEGRP